MAEEPEPMVDRDGFSVWTGSNENKYRLVKWTRRGTAVELSALPSSLALNAHDLKNSDVIQRIESDRATTAVPSSSMATSTESTTMVKRVSGASCARRVCVNPARGSNASRRRTAFIRGSYQVRGRGFRPAAMRGLPTRRTLYGVGKGG